MKLREKILLAIPFLRRFLSDKRVGVMPKVIVVMGLVYLFSFIDLSPDFIPFIGWIDDIIIVPLLINGGVKMIGEKLIQTLWNEVSHKDKGYEVIDAD
jgi:uncharacterized membrane protein YkvA (DUF1232 family)